MGIRLEITDRNREAEDAFDLGALLHPANAFAHPSDVVRDTDLTINEKRAILASWASDACAVPSAPTLRVFSAATRPVTFDEIMDALRLLDDQARATAKPVPHYRRVLSRHRDASAESRSGRRLPPLRTN
jgi:hypothetical protein